MNKAYEKARKAQQFSKECREKYIIENIGVDTINKLRMNCTSPSDNRTKRMNMCGSSKDSC